MTPNISPAPGSGLAGTNLFFNWSGIPGVSHQACWSTNLSQWIPPGDAIPGTNGLMQLLVPVTDKPQKFVRVRATY